MNIQSTKTMLLACGLKEGLLNKLGTEGCLALAAFYNNHNAESELLNQMIQLASMEIQGKVGAIELAKLKIATPRQIKNITYKQIQKILEDYLYLQDVTLARKLVTTFILANQKESAEWHASSHYNNSKNFKPASATH